MVTAIDGIPWLIDTSYCVYLRLWVASPSTSVCVRVSPLDEDTSHTGLGSPPPTLGQPYLNLQQPYFHIRSHSEVLGERTSTYGWGRGHNSTHNSYHQEKKTIQRGSDPANQELEEGGILASISPGSTKTYPCFLSLFQEPGSASRTPTFGAPRGSVS